MKTSELLNKDDVVNNIINTINELMDKDVDQLSNNDLSLLKNVSLSSISAMKKKHYTNEQILITTKNGPKNIETTIKSSLCNMSDDELMAKFGLVRA